MRELAGPAATSLVQLIYAVPYACIRSDEYLEPLTGDSPCVFGGTVPAEGQLPGGHLIEDGSKREQVAPRIQFLRTRLHRRHVGDGAERRTGTGEMLFVNRAGHGVCRCNLARRTACRGRSAPLHRSVSHHELPGRFWVIYITTKGSAAGSLHKRTVRRDDFKFQGGEYERSKSSNPSVKAYCCCGVVLRNPAGHVRG
jgi:hypothetical protein